MSTAHPHQAASPSELVARHSRLLRREDGLDFRDLNKNGKLDIYEDPRQPIEARVEDLLGQMTLAEKAGLLFINGAVGQRGWFDRREARRWGPWRRRHAADGRAEDEPLQPVADSGRGDRGSVVQQPPAICRTDAPGHPRHHCLRPAQPLQQQHLCHARQRLLPVVRDAGLCRHRRRRPGAALCRHRAP